MDFSDLGDLPSFTSGVGENEDKVVYKEILGALMSAGVGLSKDVLLLVETVLQKVSKEPMDDRTLLVSCVLIPHENRIHGKASV